MQTHGTHTYKSTIETFYLEEPIRLPSPHRINFSVCLFICLSVSLSVIYENTLNLHVGIKIRVSTWSFLSVIHPLRIPIPMYKKKVQVQQEKFVENHLLFTCITNQILALYTIHPRSVDGLEKLF
jgi:hypothetical protein